jgi:hypothetical protein
LEGDEDFGDLPDAATSDQTMIGAYDFGAGKPRLDANDRDGRANWRYVDLDISASGGSAIEFESYGALLLRVDLAGSTSSQLMHGQSGIGFFLIDSTFRGQPYVFIGGDIVRPVLKGSTFTRTNSGQSTFRFSGSSRALVQNSVFDCDGCGGQLGLTVRDDTDWVLVQGNTFLENAAAHSTSNPEPGNHSYIIWERNLYDLTTAERNWQNSFSMNNSVIRNNVAIDCAQGGGSGVCFEVNWQFGESSFNNQVVNNTFIYSAANRRAVRVSGQNIDVHNNLIWSSSTMESHHGFVDFGGSGNDFSNNWTYATSNCLNPNGSTSPCNDPEFISTTPGNADFVRPDGTGEGATGVDAGLNAVWCVDDYHADLRDDGDIDVGAVER